jgi:hypothetical protein
VNDIVQFVETVMVEREAFRASFGEQQNLNEQLMSLRRKESELVEDLRGKIQVLVLIHHSHDKLMKTGLEFLHTTTTILELVDGNGSSRGNGKISQSDNQLGRGSGNGWRTTPG